MDGQQLLTPREAADLFQVDQKTLAQWTRTGVLTSVRTLGGHNRYRPADMRRLPRLARRRR